MVRCYLLTSTFNSRTAFSFPLFQPSTYISAKLAVFPLEENTLFYLVVKINTSFLTLSLCVFQLDYKTSYGERMLTTFLFVYPNKSYFLFVFPEILFN